MNYFPQCTRSTIRHTHISPPLAAHMDTWIHSWIYCMFVGCMHNAVCSCACMRVENLNTITTINTCWYCVRVLMRSAESGVFCWRWQLNQLSKNFMHSVHACVSVTVYDVVCGACMCVGARLFCLYACLTARIDERCFVIHSGKHTRSHAHTYDGHDE